MRAFVGRPPTEVEEPDPEDPDDATLADEFADLSHWQAQYVVGDPGYGLDSDFLGDMSQVSVAGGTLSITAVRDNPSAGREYSSASITSPDFAAFRGIWETRIKYPGGQGVWPAFWFLEEGSLSTPPELDVFEAYPGTGLTPNHGSSGAGVAVISNHYSGPAVEYEAWDAGTDLTAGYHVWRVEWLSVSSLRVLVDGVLRKEFTANLPNVPMQPILTLALGATGYRVDDGSTTPSPLVMEVDYFRFWAV